MRTGQRHLSVPVCSSGEATAPRFSVGFNNEAALPPMDPAAPANVLPPSRAAWFGLPDSNAEYIEASLRKETWTARDTGGAVAGVTLIDRRFAHILEIHLAVMMGTAHGSGV